MSRITRQHDLTLDVISLEMIHMNLYIRAKVQSSAFVLSDATQSPSTLRQQTIQVKTNIFVDSDISPLASPRTRLETKGWLAEICTRQPRRYSVRNQPTPLIAGNGGKRKRHGRRCLPADNWPVNGIILF